MKLRQIISLLTISWVVFTIQNGSRWAEAAARTGDGALPALKSTDRPPVSELTPRDLYRYCDRNLEELRTRAHDMVGEAQLKFVDRNEIRENQKQNRRQFSDVQSHLGQFFPGLTAQQLHGIYNRIHQLERWRTQVDDRLNAMDQVIEAPVIDQGRLIEESRLTERAIRAYQLHFHRMGEELGIRGR